MLRSSALIVGLLGAGLAILLKYQHPGPPQNAPFQQLRPGVFRHLNDFPLLPAPLLPVPTATWLIKGTEDNAWILIDAGPSTPSYQKSLRAAIKSQLQGRDEDLKLILLTHGHPDHVEGLPWLLEAFPKTPLAFHEEEAPYVTGGRQYAELQGDTLIFEKFGKFTQGVNSSLPAHRTFQLKGAHGDVASSISGLLTGAPSWLAPGTLEYFHNPGHSPGHVVFIHKPSKSVVAGDSFSHQGYWPVHKGPAAFLGRPYLIGTSNLTATRVSQKRIAGLPQVVTFFPSHDDVAGVGKAELQAYTKNFANSY